jgi:hypothetical protein
MCHHANSDPAGTCAARLISQPAGRAPAGRTDRRKDRPMPPPEPPARTDPSTAPSPDESATTGTGLGTLDLLRPLSHDLIAEALSAEGWSYTTDDEGDLFGVWDDTPVFFRAVNGSILQITSFTRVDMASTQPVQLYEFCNGWNQDRLWPKAYVHIDDPEQGGDRTGAAVYGEATTHLPEGVTLDQLRQLLRCGVATSCQLAGSLTGKNG